MQKTTKKMGEIPALAPSIATPISILVMSNDPPLRRGKYNYLESFKEQVAQRSCGCPLRGSVQGQVGWSSEQLGLVKDVPAHGRGVGTRLSSRSLPTLTIL